MALGSKYETGSPAHSKTQYNYKILRQKANQQYKWDLPEEFQKIQTEKED